VFIGNRIYFDFMKTQLTHAETAAAKDGENIKLTPEMLSFLQAEVAEMQSEERICDDEPRGIDRHGEPADVIS